MCIPSIVRSIACAGILAILLLCSAGSVAQAENPPNVIKVSTTADEMDAFDQECSLREALRNANTNSQFSPVVNECRTGSGSATDVVVLKGDSHYKLTLVGPGTNEGDLDVIDNPQLPAGVDDLRIEVDSQTFALITQDAPGERVMENHQARTTLRDVWLVSGYAVDGGSLYNAGGTMFLNEVDIGYSTATGDGGGVYNDGDMTIRGGTIVQSVAGGFGGNIYHADGTMSLINVSMQLGKAVSGGAIYNAAQLMIESDSRIFNGNVATEHGGAIANVGSGILTVSGSRIAESTANLGGGIANLDDARLTLIDVLVAANEAQSGGGIYNESSVPIELLRTRVEENTASFLGGGLLFNATGDSAPGLITRSLFTGNTASQGAAVVVSKGQLSIGNTTFSGNEPIPGGWGENLVVLSDGEMTATNVTFAATGSTAGLANHGVLRLQNSIIDSTGAEACLFEVPMLSLGSNLASDNTCHGLGAEGDLVYTQSVMAPLADNGGNTLTHALLAASPAIDAGIGDACASEAVAGLDQRGGLRPAGNSCDIGAFEKGATLRIFADGFE